MEKKCEEERVRVEKEIAALQEQYNERKDELERKKKERGEEKELCSQMEDLPDSNTMFTKLPSQSCSFYICSVKSTYSKGFCEDSIRYIKNQGQCLAHSRGSVGFSYFSIIVLSYQVT